VSEDKHPVFFLGEIRLNQNHTLNHIWQDSTSNGRLNIPVGKASRLIVSCVGSAVSGFTPERKWVFRSKSTKDCHEVMMVGISGKFFLTIFINYFKQSSIINMGNANYHGVTLNKVPNTSAK
jgi:hypothetical protein